MLPSLLLAAAAAALLRARLPTGAWPARTAARAPTPLASTHWVLGLNQYSHDAGACLIAADGERTVCVPKVRARQRPLRRGASG